MLIFFLISLVGLIILFSWKLFETKTDQILVSKKILNRSDLFLENNSSKLKKYYTNLMERFPNFFNNLFKYISDKISSYLIKVKKIIEKKILKMLGFDEESILNKNKGSASLFLRNIVEDESRK